jgi:hypothetical protein
MGGCFPQNCSRKAQSGADLPDSIWSEQRLEVREDKTFAVDEKDRREKGREGETGIEGCWGGFY